MEAIIKRYIICSIVLIFMFFAAVSKAPAFQSRSEQNLMHTLLESLARAFVLSQQADGGEQPETNEDIVEAIKTLTENAEALEDHGRDQGQHFDFLQQSMVRNAYDAENSVLGGDYEESRFALRELTESCFSCHMRLPGNRRNEFGRRFSEALDIEVLPLEERARLEVITRQFDAALTSYESLINRFPWEDPEFTFNETFENYLKVSLRVRRDIERPLRTLNAVRMRTDIPGSLLEPVGDWIESLKLLQSRPVDSDTLEYARTLVREAQLRRLFPDDRHGLVQLIAASSVLHPFVRGKPNDTEGLAEAYFLLAVTESHISTGAWISETEFFLETSIRVDPGSKFADRAYAELETYILMTYGGPDEIDPDILDYLTELKGLIEAESR